ncbi:hypothetical protein FH972_022976 [Carpinus fangiana]|uniref:Zn(2)-C6 fungal-type domain-containing protein n=1 Tax=Carpinus fangiana TaxID=176857 RepID=A0A5N6KUB9_9ROSI|nr:hypothetical protein FH972_022976 [Carpinus fangiana]
MPQHPDHASPSSASSGDENEDDMVKIEDRLDGKNPQKTFDPKSKDPSRPKRKKARRACHACQRAHLTCGDERPCQRCVKRGLADSCQDGARKKAKYLHDTPVEALIPGNAAPYPHQHSQNGSKRDSIELQTQGLSEGSSAFASQGVPRFGSSNSFTQASPHHMMPSMQDQSPYPSYANNQSPVPVQYSPHQPSPMQTLSHQHNSSNQSNQPFPSQAINFDPNDSSMFNFDLASMNFGNHYGAMEFGMLGHMVSGANDPSFAPSQRPHSASTGGFDDLNPGFVDNHSEMMFNGDAQWPAGHKVPVHNQYQHLNEGQRRNSQGPHAFAIGAGPGSLSGSSPQSNTDPVGYDQNGNAVFPQSSQQQQTIFNPNSNLSQRAPNQASSARIPKQPVQQPDIDKPQESISKRLAHFQTYLPVATRTRTSSSIYSKVTKPYPYTSAFHAFTAFLIRRFPTAKRVAIAKALTIIRPSFISCARDLVDDDLVFMEKCFLRAVFDYEDFQHDVCTPTIICRRTGEVAHVTKEFCIMSGWNREVLLGKKLNRNANFAELPESGMMSIASSRGGYTTPNKANDKTLPQWQDFDEGAGRQQPVFLAELLDPDSVVNFYEDYSELAFADSKGSIRRRCQVMKYMTKEDIATRNVKNGTDTSGGTKEKKGHRKDNSEVSRNGIFNEEGMRNLGARDGRVDCMYCWQVKRDVFNIPMMIVLNTPLLQNPHPPEQWPNLSKGNLTLTFSHWLKKQAHANVTTRQRLRSASTKLSLHIGLEAVAVAAAAAHIAM